MMWSGSVSIPIQICKTKGPVTHRFYGKALMLQVLLFRSLSNLMYYSPYTFHSRIPVDLVSFEFMTIEIPFVVTGVKVVVLY